MSSAAPHRRRGSPLARHASLATALLSAVLALALLQWRHVSDRERLHRVAGALDYAGQARLHVTRAYLIALGAETGRAGFSRTDADAALDRAALAVDDWLAGRPVIPGADDEPPTDPEARRRVLRYRAAIRAFRPLLARSGDPRAAVDLRNAFAGLEAQGDSIEHQALALLAATDARGRGTHVAVMFGMALFVGLAAVSLHAAGAAGRRAAARSDQMQALAAALAAAGTPREVADATRDHGILGVGAPLGTVGVLADGGRTLEVLAVAGYRDSDLAGWMRFPNSGALPAPDAIERRRPVFAGSRDEILARYPALREVSEASGFRATAVVPLVTGEGETASVLGYVAFEFREDRDFPDEDRRFLETLGGITAQAMARALSHRAEQEARAQAQAERRRLALVLEQLPVGVILVGPDGAVLQHNAALERVLQHPVHPAADISGYAAYGGVHGDGRPYAPEDYPIVRALLHGDRVDQEPTRYLRGDGREAMISISAAPVEDEESGTRYAVATLQDVTALHEVERALRESEARFRELTERLPLGVFRSDAEGKTVYCNPRLTELLGLAEEEFHSGAWLGAVRPEDRDELEGELRAFREGGSDSARFEFRIAHPVTGQLRDLVIESALVRDTAGGVKGSVGVLEDVTPQRALEAQLRQAQKMEAVGRLAGGIAHDFNNMLQVVTMCTNLLLEEVPEEDEARQWVVEIRNAAGRAADLTRQLLVFSRQQVLQTRPFDLNELVVRANAMLRRLIGEHVAVEMELGAGLPPGLGDPGQVEQALVNLAVNARDAMPEGGTLTIFTSIAELDPASPVDDAGPAAGSYLVLGVADTGTGMDAETLSHVFEPFFTTKEPGKGTGLGLAMVYGAARQMGGHVTVRSELGAGSTFQLYVPVAGSGAPALPATPVPGPSGNETVLVVEDDDGVRRVVRTALGRLGYTVLEATDGQGALRLLESYAGPLDLLLSDVVLPGIGGRAVAEAVTALHPGVAVVFMSGYNADETLLQRVRSGEALIEKPFSVSHLAQRIRETLDRRAPRDPGGTGTS